MRSDFPALTSRRIGVQLVGLAAVLVVSLAIAGAVRAAEDPADFVRQVGDEATKVVADPSLTPNQRHAAYRRMLAAYFDLDLISRLVLGRHWKGATPEQQQAYRQLFEAYVLAVYGRRLQDYAGETLEVGRVVDKGRKGVFVASRVHRPQGPAIDVAWRLLDDGQSWRIVDLVVEGVSMVMTHRAEFDAVIRQSGGVEGLLARLHGMVAQFQSPAAVQASKL